jgi:hypothetical protein
LTTRSKIQDRIRKKEREIEDLEAALREARAYLQALNDTLRLLPRDVSPDALLRPESMPFKAYRYLRTLGRPANITEITKATGASSRSSLAKSLNFYANNREIFTRISAGVYGLTEFEESPKEHLKEDEEEGLVHQEEALV